MLSFRGQKLFEKARQLIAHHWSHIRKIGVPLHLQLVLSFIFGAKRLKVQVSKALLVQREACTVSELLVA